MRSPALPFFFASFALQASPDATSREFFEAKIRPVFAKSCLPCHSGATRMSGLDMSSREGLIKGGVLGTSLVPGDPGKSLLIAAVNHQHERLRMPMGQARLGSGELTDLVDWVKAGAVWPEAAAPRTPTKGVITAEQRAFWSFQPVRAQTPPAVRDQAWPKTDIDRFLLARMEEKNVKPAPPADRRTLLRRVYFDLIGLPPTAEETASFERDGDLAMVVDRLLASPRYGERWGRHWLDIARYSDDQLEAEVEAPYANAFRYRDWVIAAFNQDMPYNEFVKAQIAGDAMGERYVGGLGFYGLRPHTQDDRVDITGRAFLGLTTACAQCHDHKFDPIPTTDYYALQGVFESTKDAEYPLAPANVVKDWKAREKQVTTKKTEIRDFLHNQASQLAELLAAQTARYVTAARTIIRGKEDIATVAARERFDAETLTRWVQYLSRGKWDHPWLQDVAAETFDTAMFQQQVLAVLKERKAVDEKNLILAAQAKKFGPNTPAETAVSLQTNSFYLWRDLFFNDFYGRQFKQEDDGLLYYGPNRGYFESDGTIERFLQGEWKLHLNRLREELAAAQAALPARYPYYHTISDSDKIHNERVRIGGKPESPGEEVPRRFLTILSDGQPFTKGSGRTELAEAIASPVNPLTARVIVNRVWHHHFGSGIVRTPSDFGFMGDRPSHPELLDHLSAKFVANGWSLKALHREILLSAAYQASSARTRENEAIDPENRLFWRANVRRLDAEAIRDSLLAVSGELDLTAGGVPSKLNDPKNARRSVYGFVSRSKADGALALFDFPNANQTNEKRVATMTPTQQLFLLNSDFVVARARKLAAWTESGQDPAPRIRRLYQQIYGRQPSSHELKLGQTFTASAPWWQYAQALLGANEFVMVN